MRNDSGRRSCARTDDFCVLGKSSMAEMLPVIIHLMDHLKLRLNVEKTRCVWSPDAPFEFLGYRYRVQLPSL